MAALERFLDIVFGMVPRVSVLRLYQSALVKRCKHTSLHRIESTTNKMTEATIVIRYGLVHQKSSVPLAQGTKF